MFKLAFLISAIFIASCLADEVNVNDFSNDALLAHNLYRRIHGVPSLKLNTKLSTIALRRAQTLAKTGELNVIQNVFDGQNVGETVGAVGGFASYNGISATQLWYSVVSKFDEEGESSSEGASFTQIVWKSTREVGFGIAKGDDGKFYFVAEYFPSGNIRGKYEDNVFQLTDELINTASCQNSEQVISESEEIKTTPAPVEQEEVTSTTSKPALIRIKTTKVAVQEDQVEETTVSEKIAVEPIEAEEVTVKPAHTIRTSTRLFKHLEGELVTATNRKPEIITEAPQSEETLDLSKLLTTKRMRSTTVSSVDVDQDEKITVSNRKLVKLLTTTLESSTVLSESEEESTPVSLKKNDRKHLKSKLTTIETTTVDADESTSTEASIVEEIETTTVRISKSEIKKSKKLTQKKRIEE